MSLPNAPIERIIRKAGAERVSEGAIEELKFALEDLGDEIASESINMASHAGRNTVKEEDVELAMK